MAENAERPVKLTQNDFIFGKQIGDGSFSTVYLAKEISTQREFAAKVCGKEFIKKEDKVDAVMREKNIMSLLTAQRDDTAPFFVHLAFTFQTSQNLYFMLTYCPNGDMLQTLRQVGTFDHASACFYTAELIRGLEHMRSLYVVHRDLKPENILFDERMHIKISDFGSAKDLIPNDEDDGRRIYVPRKSTFVGTAHYVSPEVLNSRKVCIASDLWSLGCIVFQLVAGNYPFNGGSEYLIFKEVIKAAYTFPENFFPDAKDLVSRLIAIEPHHRLGAMDTFTPSTPFHYTSLRNHAFVAHLDFERLHLTTPPKICAFVPSKKEHVWDDSVEAGLEHRELELLGQLLDTPSPYQATNGSAQTTPTTSSSANDSAGVSQTLPTTSRLTNGSTDSGVTTPISGTSPSHTRTNSRSSTKKVRRNLADVSPEERQTRLEEQRKSKWNAFVEGNLILKQGELEKRKGLFPRRRMFLLTTGPHLYYVDPSAMVLKGEVPLSGASWPEAKNFATFFYHTPNRTYYLEDLSKTSHLWKEALEDIREFYFPKAVAE